MSLSVSAWPIYINITGFLDLVVVCVLFRLIVWIGLMGGVCLKKWEKRDEEINRLLNEFRKSEFLVVLNGISRGWEGQSQN